MCFCMREEGGSLRAKRTGRGRRVYRRKGEAVLVKEIILPSSKTGQTTLPFIALHATICTCVFT